MEKHYKTFRQRLTILRERGMNIPINSKKQRDIIKKYNYYNLINAYKDPFLEAWIVKSNATLLNDKPRMEFSNLSICAA